MRFCTNRKTEIMEIISKHKYYLYVKLEPLIKKHYHLTETNEIVDFVKQKVIDGVLVPIKSNGLRPGKFGLYNKYMLVESISSKLQNTFAQLPNLDLSWYAQPHKGVGNPFRPDSYHQQFWQDLPFLQKINAYLAQKHDYSSAVSINERSFQIFGYEKAFEKKNGKTIFDHLHLHYADLNMYSTYEFPTIIPLSHLGSDLLLIENEDPVYDLAKLYLESPEKLTNFRALVYSGGQALIASLNNPLNRLFDLQNIKHYYYWGDLDGKGIEMFLNAQKAVANLVKGAILSPWQTAYHKMLLNSIQARPIIAENNRYQASQVAQFTKYFSLADQKKLKLMLEKQVYLPQEVLTINDFE